RHRRLSADRDLRGGRGRGACGKRANARRIGSRSAASTSSRAPSRRTVPHRTTSPSSVATTYSRGMTACPPTSSGRLSCTRALSRAARAIANLVRCVTDGVRPLTAWVRVPVLLPGERACTRDEPACSIYGGLAAIEAKAGIIDAAVWIGYAWADEPRCSAAIVVTGTDRDAILREARALAETYWNARADFSFSVPAGDADWCIKRGLAAKTR